MNQTFFPTAIALLALAAQPAFAQSSKASDARLGLGIAGGVSHFRGVCDAGSTCDMRASAARVSAGYRFAEDAWAEVSYNRLGTARQGARFGGSSLETSLQGAYWGFGGAYRPRFQNGWGVVLHAGAAYAVGEVSANLSSVLDQLPLDTAVKRSSWQAYAGAGATYAVTRDIQLELTYDIARVGFQVAPPASTARESSSSRVGTLMLGARLQF